MSEHPPEYLLGWCPRHRLQTCDHEDGSRYCAEPGCGWSCASLLPAYAAPVRVSNRAVWGSDPGDETDAEGEPPITVSQHLGGPLVVWGPDDLKQPDGLKQAARLQQIAWSEAASYTEWDIFPGDPRAEDPGAPHGRCPRHGSPYTPGENCPDCDAGQLKKIGDYPAVQAALAHYTAMLREVEAAEPDIASVTREIARGA